MREIRNEPLLEKEEEPKKQEEEKQAAHGGHPFSCGAKHDEGSTPW